MLIPYTSMLLSAIILLYLVFSAICHYHHDRTNDPSSAFSLKTIVLTNILVSGCIIAGYFCGRLSTKKNRGSDVPVNLELPA